MAVATLEDRCQGGRATDGRSPESLLRRELSFEREPNLDDKMNPY